MVQTVIARLEHWPVSVTLANADAEDFPLIFVNQAFTKLTGYTAAEVVGRNCRFLQPTETDPEVKLQINDALLTRQSVTVALLNQRRDGSRFHNMLFLEPLSVRSGHRLVLGCQFEIDPLHLDMGGVSRQTQQINGLIDNDLRRTNAIRRMRRDALRARTDTVQMIVQNYLNVPISPIQVRAASDRQAHAFARR